MTTNQYRFSTHFLPCGLVKAKSEQHIKEKLQATKITGKEHKSCPDMELSPYNKEKGLSQIGNTKSGSPVFNDLVQKNKNRHQNSMAESIAMQRSVKNRVLNESFSRT